MSSPQATTRISPRAGRLWMSSTSHHQHKLGGMSQQLAGERASTHYEA